MVKNTGKTSRTGATKPVNQPESLQVEESQCGMPSKLKMPHWQPVSHIEDSWRIDDEWWRSEAVSRLYFTVILASGRRLVIYKNLAVNCWFRQPY